MTQKNKDRKISSYSSQPPVKMLCGFVKAQQLPPMLSPAFIAILMILINKIAYDQKCSQEIHISSFAQFRGDEHDR